MRFFKIGFWVVTALFIISIIRVEILRRQVIDLQISQQMTLGEKNRVILQQEERIAMMEKQFWNQGTEGCQKSVKKLTRELDVCMSLSKAMDDCSLASCHNDPNTREGIVSLVYGMWHAKALAHQLAMDD